MTQPLDCPKCSRPMKEWTAARVTLDHCTACKGLWFDKGELATHFRNLGSEVAEGELVEGGETRFGCPRCQGLHLRAARLDAVPVDVCTECHGIFLDLGEVHELIGAAIRGRRDLNPETTGFDNFTLGLYIGAHLGS